MEAGVDRRKIRRNARERQERIERARQLRGLLIHYRALPQALRPGYYRRGLISALPPVRKKTGNCRWCARPTAGRAFAWHRYCVNAYRAALGVPTGVDGKALIPPEQCPCGEKGTELDHKIAISVAYASGDERAVRRAYLLDNLQWLCHQCHARKTGEDRRKANNLKHGRAEEWRPPRRGDVPAGQLMLMDEEMTRS